MVVKANQFGQDAMSYFEYMRRRWRTGATAKRVHFNHFAILQRQLAEGEFILAALSDQEKRRSPTFKKLNAEQGRLRKKLLIGADEPLGPEDLSDADAEDLESIEELLGPAPKPQSKTPFRQDLDEDGHEKVPA